MADIFCKYCQHRWKYKKEYDKHLACCEYFYQSRRKPDMDDYGNKLPSNKELFRFVQELSLKCERLEREVSRLKSTVSVRQKKAILECLNTSASSPSITFCEWWKQITLTTSKITPTEQTDMDAHWSEIDNPFLFRVFQQGLVEGIKYVLDHYTRADKSLPIRCFTQKSNIFYIYYDPTNEAPSKTKTSSWKMVSAIEFETMIDYLSQLFVREYLLWQRKNISTIEMNEQLMEEQMNYMRRVNSMRPTKEKGIIEIRKWLFSTLEENAQFMTEHEYI